MSFPVANIVNMMELICVLLQQQLLHPPPRLCDKPRLLSACSSQKWSPSLSCCCAHVVRHVIRQGNARLEARRQAYLQKVVTSCVSKL